MIEKKKKMLKNEKHVLEIFLGVDESDLALLVGLTIMNCLFLIRITRVKSAFDPFL